jgi:uncharacterized short protein YbdD (DUF466 family)
MTEAVMTRARLVCELVVKTARLMVGIPDYETYVMHRQTNHPGQPVMTYEGVLQGAPGRALCSQQGQVPRLLLICGVKRMRF